MKKGPTPPGKPPREKKRPAETEAGKHPAQGEKTEVMPAGNIDRGSPDQPSEEEVISTWRKPLTNQDEQEKITNTGGEDIPIADK